MGTSRLRDSRSGADCTEEARRGKAPLVHVGKATALASLETVEQLPRMAR